MTIEFSVLELDLVEQFVQYGYADVGELRIERISPDPALVASFSGGYPIPYDFELIPGRYRLSTEIYTYGGWGTHAYMRFGIPTPGTLAFLACAAMLGVRRSRRA